LLLGRASNNLCAIRFITKEEQVKRSLVPCLAVLLCSLSTFADVQLRTDRIDEAKTILLTADFNGDGLDDIVGWNSLQFNLGGRFGPPVDIKEIPGSPDAMHPTVGVAGVAYFNGDAYADLLVRREGSTDLVLLGTGSGSFTVKTLPDFDGWLSDVLDFNGDGLGDLVYQKPDRVTLVRGVGDGTFAVQQSFPWNPAFGSYWQANEPPVADFNSDGRPDFLLRTERSILLFLTQADGSFAMHERFTRFGPRTLQVGDLNGDGHADIAFTSRAQEDSAMSAVFGDGTGRFPGYARLITSEGQWYRSGPDIRSIAIADFVPGGAQELVYGTHEGEVIVLSGVGDQLTEVARHQVDGEGLDVVPMRFRSATPQLVIHGHKRANDNRFAWVVETEGEVAGAQVRAEGRLPARLLTSTAGGSFSVDIQSDCPVNGLTEFSFEREGLFVHFESTAVIESANAAYLPGELYVELRVKEGNTIRELIGTLEPTPNGLKGKLLELQPTPCGRLWAAHKVTAIPMR
jgi:hypothetical protein